jgi:hypothetical protein
MDRASSKETDGVGPPHDFRVRKETHYDSDSAQEIFGDHA